jgi:type I restriction enzyme S subunit
VSIAPLNVRYFCYQLSSLAERLNAWGQGSTFVELSRDALAAFPITVPPTATQRTIADYLDREAARIDTLVAAKRQMVELSEERLAAVIDTATGASARGVPVKRFLDKRITDGPHETPEFVDDGIPFLSIEAVVDDRLIFENCRYISWEAHREYVQKCQPLPGDVLLAKTGATIGKVVVVHTDRDFSIWSPLALLRPRRDVMRPEYLWFCLRSRAVQSQIRLAATQNTQPNIAMGDIGDLRIAVPDLQTQDAIVDALWRESERAHEVINCLNVQIDLLQERRQALITAAVTGQLDTSEAA